MGRAYDEEYDLGYHQERGRIRARQEANRQLLVKALIIGGAVAAALILLFSCALGSLVLKGSMP